jgi:hypothetical protein
MSSDLHAARPVPANIEAWNGRWKWNPATAVFDNPVHTHAWAGQIQDVSTDGERLLVKVMQTFVNGKRRGWTWDGAFDGIPRPMSWDDNGKPAAFIAFTLLADNMVSDGFFGLDNLFFGSEYFVFGGDNYQVWGRSTTAGKVYDYFEEWDRIG